jgi:monoterpene epsilon-lactone hydrolase
MTVTVDLLDEGVIQIKELRVPLSPALSPQARELFLDFMNTFKYGDLIGSQDSPPDIKKISDIQNQFMEELDRRHSINCPINISCSTIGGIEVQILASLKDDAANKQDRILLFLHGGAFLFGQLAKLESIPICALSGIKTIAINYRIGDQVRFPEASYNLLSVYKEVLSAYSPDKIGIYGTSAGASALRTALTLMTYNNLPMPGAVALLSGGYVSTSGDSTIMGHALTAKTVANLIGSGGSYFSDVDNDTLVGPLLSPGDFPSIISQFPKTLLVTATRDTDLSGAVISQRKLIAAGVPVELNLWEGLPHAFWVVPGIPESTEVYECVAEFFTRSL